MQLDLLGATKLSPSRVQTSVRSDLRDLASNITAARRDLEQLSDPRKLKGWLRKARAEAAAAADRDFSDWFSD
jgi:hypothetical protein